MCNRDTYNRLSTVIGVTEANRTLFGKFLFYVDTLRIITPRFHLLADNSHTYISCVDNIQNFTQYI